MELPDDPYHPLRPARRTQWLVSVLAHHYGQDRGLENELMVLATGLDQYLQEVFHHLDWRGESSISGDEFRALCEVLGLEPGAQEEEEDECEGLLERLPDRLTFRQFHARLCGYFSARGGMVLPMSPKNQRCQMRLRKRDTPRRSEGNRKEDELQRLEEENHSLRELVEDLRAALQSSDARCLALQVGLHRNVASQKGQDLSTSNIHLSKNYTVTTKCVQRKVDLIQDSRDKQMEEVLKNNKDLEEELSKTQKLLVYLEEANQLLMSEQAEIRKRAECVRQVLSACYGKVKDLEEKSSQSPALQRRMDQLEIELQNYRSEEAMVRLAAQENKILFIRPCPAIVTSEIRSPTEDADYVHREYDQLFRSVEGRAASDEEEEWWIREPAGEKQDIKTNVSWVPSGHEDQRIQKLLFDNGFICIDPRNMPFLLVEGVTRLTEELTNKEQEIKDLEMLMDEMKVPFIEELERKDEEIELLRIDLQMLETERVRLSLIEEKLLDVLELLQQLRELEISNQDMGRVLLHTLEMCREPEHGKEHLFEVLDTLHHQLSVCDLFRHQQENKDNKAPSLANSLVISC